MEVFFSVLNMHMHVNDIETVVIISLMRWNDSKETSFTYGIRFDNFRKFSSFPFHINISLLSIDGHSSFKNAKTVHAWFRDFGIFSSFSTHCQFTRNYVCMYVCMYECA